MPDHRIAFDLTFVCLGILFVGLAIPLIRGKVRPNRAYGIRIRAAFRSEEAWYRINRHGGFCMVWLGVAQVLLGCVDYLFLPARPTLPVFALHLCAPLILVVPFTVALFRYPKR